jgi:hypothetical protein
MLRRIAVDRFKRPAVDREIGLAVSVKVQCAQLQRACDWFLEDSGVDGLALIYDQPRARDV